MATQPSGGPPPGCGRRGGGGEGVRTTEAPRLPAAAAPPRRRAGGTARWQPRLQPVTKAPSQPDPVPQAGAQGYLAAGRDSPTRTPSLQQPDPRPPTGPRRGRTSSPGSPAPAPSGGTAWHPQPGSRCLRTTRQAGVRAQACVSAAETTRDLERAGSAGHTGGGGWGGTLQGLLGNGGGAIYFSSAPRRRHSQVGLGRLKSGTSFQP